jgi:membrane protease YdiL (CAAX protease family)
MSIAEDSKTRPMTVFEAALIFTVGTAYFFLLLFTLLPFLKSAFSLNPALPWFITGYFLFVPLFLYAIKRVRDEGNRGIRPMLDALHIRFFSRKEWVYSVSGLLLIFASNGLIFGISILANTYWNYRPLTTTPWFIEMVPFQGSERWLVLVWLPMFFFNIAGEEILWRGYIQARLSGAHSWLLCSLLWLGFHAPFGIDLIILLLPALIIIPYVFYKTRNTLTGIFIHGLYNGPVFLALALGIIK